MAASKGIYGLSGSGMDIDTMVKQMLTGYQSNYDKVYKQKVTQEWKKAAYNEFYKSMTEYKDYTFSSYKLQGTMSPRKATSSDSGVVSATANGAAAEVSHDVAVTQLAQRAYIQSNGIERKTGAQPNGIKLSDLVNVSRPAGAADTDIAISFAIEDGESHRTIRYTYEQLEGKTLNDLASDINKLDGNVKASYDSVNDSFVIYNKKSGADNKVGISIDTVYYDSNNNELPLPNETRQATQELFNSLHLETYRSGETSQALNFDIDNGFDSIDVKGIDGKAIVDGREYTAKDGKVTVQGVTYTLNKLSDYTESTTETELVYDAYGKPVYETDADGNKVPQKDENGNVMTDSNGDTIYVQKTRAKRIYDTARVDVKADADKIVENVKKFVEDYNKLIDSMNDKIYETQYKDYGPLTDDEKSAMTEEQIKKWEEKAHSGLLNKDSIMRDVVNDMRSALSLSVTGLTGKYTNASSIGITTTTNEEHGHIQLDEEQLRAAIEEDPDVVWKIFGTQGEENDRNTKGVAQRLTDVMADGLKRIESEAGTTDEIDYKSVIGKRLDSLAEQLTKLADQMDRRESELYKQFNAMETAIASLNQQYNFVTSYTSGS